MQSERNVSKALFAEMDCSRSITTRGESCCGDGLGGEESLMGVGFEVEQAVFSLRLSA